MDPISIRDVLYYLVAAGDSDRVPAGAYDIIGPETTSYSELLRTYARISGKLRREHATSRTEWRSGVDSNPRCR